MDSNNTLHAKVVDTYDFNDADFNPIIAISRVLQKKWYNNTALFNNKDRDTGKHLESVDDMKFLTPIIQTFIFNIFLNNSSEYIDCFLANIAAFVFWGDFVTLSYLSLIIWYKINKKLSKNCG